MITVENLRVIATASGLPLVKGISFSVAKGEVLGLVGESGSGKTTISLALLGYAKPGTSIDKISQVKIGDTDIVSLPERSRRSARGNLVSYVPQDPTASLNPAISIETQLVEGLVTGSAPISRHDAKERIAGLLVEVGLPSSDEFLSRYPSQLSGGQLQRVAIAMAVARRPRLIVLDEPTTGLDVSTQTEVLQMMGGLCRTHHIAAVYVSHDLAVVAHIADKVVVLYAGSIAEYGRKEDIFASPSHPYTQALLDAVPSVRANRSLRSIRGQAPALSDRDRGCLFSPRCTFAVAACVDAPELRPLAGSDHAVACHRAGRTSRADGGTIAPTQRRANSDRVLEVQAVGASYGDHEILSDVSFDLMKGECLAIVGESGSGKTTLSRCLIGLHHNWSGRILFNNTELARSAGARNPLQRQKLQYVFQNPYASLNPRKMIRSNLAVPVQHFFGGSTSEANAKIHAALERVELRSSYADRFPNELSGGEKQRVAIARALLTHPEVIICDEITSALDVSVQAAIIELLRSLMLDGLSLVFVTHNLAVVRSLADRVAVLNNGKVIELNGTDQVLSNPSAAYTQMLLSHTLELA